MEDLPMKDKHQDLSAPRRVEGGANDGPTSNGIDRRNFLSCMAWAGTGLLWTMAGGVPTSKLFAATTGAAGGRAAHADSGFSFVQISDSHIGFNKAANQDVTQHAAKSSLKKAASDATPSHRTTKAQLCNLSMVEGQAQQPASPTPRP
jgi:hypothetical protein